MSRTNNNKKGVPAAAPKVSTESENKMAPAGKDLSSVERSRGSLMRDLYKRRGILTQKEYMFIEDLFQQGSDSEVKLAYERLLDTDIFFMPDGITSVSDQEWEAKTFLRASQATKSTQDRNWKSMDLSHVNPDYLTSAPSNEESNFESDELGTQERQAHLEQRRNSDGPMFGKMWTAHSTGLQVSKLASQRSLLSRQKNVLLLSKQASRRSLLSRQHGVLTLSKQASRGSLFTSQQSKSPVVDRRKSEGTPSLRSSLPSLFQKSDVKRKSVSFLNVPIEVEEVGSEGSEGFEIEHVPSDTFSKPSENEPSNSSLDNSLSYIDDLSSQSIHRKQPALCCSNSSSCSSFRSSGKFSSSDSLRSIIKPNDTNDEKKDDEEWEADFEHAFKSARRKTLERPVLIRVASENFYLGEGVEVADFEVKDSLLEARRLDRMTSFGMESANSIRSHSFDETMTFDRLTSTFERTIHRSLSDENISGGSTFFSFETSRLEKMLSGEDDTLDYYDPWQGVDHEYGSEQSLIGRSSFLILGTSGDDLNSQPHVLSPPLMESVLTSVPYSVSGDNLWLKYSLVRDGANLITLLQHARGAKHSILAMETVDGEVFGAFTTEPWRKNWNYFGGGQSFLWKMEHSRKEKCHSLIDQVQMEGEVDIYRCSGQNGYIQLCTQDKIAVGGGSANSLSSEMLDRLPTEAHEWGFGLSLDGDLLHGTSAPSVTFMNPPLSTMHSDGSRFEILNIELWALTPCMSLKEAEKLELGNLFLQRHMRAI
jgi:hypothetical protein